MSETIIPVVVGGIIKDGKILLIRRKKKPYQGLWSLPGGKVESCEAVTDAMAREIREETGLHVESMEFLGIVSERIDEGEKAIGGHLIHVFLLNVRGTNLAKSVEGKLQWFPMEDLSKIEEDAIPTDLFIISHMLCPKHKGSYVYLLEQENGRYCLKEVLAI